MENIIFRPDNFKKWSIEALTKLEKVIDSCKNEAHLEAAKNMVDNFTIITALEDADEFSMDIIIHQLWLRIKLQKSKIYASH